MNQDLKRYDLFGWDYPHVNPLAEKEIDWYAEFARRTGGPVLELACGSARLLTAIARIGFTCDGIDLSAGMLAIAEEALSLLPPEVRSRIRLHRADISRFHLDRQFGLVFIADNSLRELSTRKQQLSCLRCVHRHLRSDGKFLVTVRRFDPVRYVHGRRDIPWSEPLRHPLTGDLVQRRIETRLSKDGKRIRGTMIYRTTRADGGESVEEYPFETPVMCRNDYLSLFSETGFSPHVFADYEEREEDGQNQVLCFVCDKNEI